MPGRGGGKVVGIYVVAHQHRSHSRACLCLVYGVPRLCAGAFLCGSGLPAALPQDVSHKPWFGFRLQHSSVQASQFWVDGGEEWGIYSQRLIKYTVFGYCRGLMSRDWSYTLYLGGGGLMPREDKDRDLGGNSVRHGFRV